MLKSRRAESLDSTCLSTVGNVIQMFGFLRRRWFGGEGGGVDWWAWQQDVWITIAFWLPCLDRESACEWSQAAYSFSSSSSIVSPRSVYSFAPAEMRLSSSSASHLSHCSSTGVNERLGRSLRRLLVVVSVQAGTRGRLLPVFYSPFLTRRAVLAGSGRQRLIGLTVRKTSWIVPVGDRMQL